MGFKIILLWGFVYILPQPVLTLPAFLPSLYARSYSLTLQKYLRFKSTLAESKPGQTISCNLESVKFLCVGVDFFACPKGLSIGLSSQWNLGIVNTFCLLFDEKRLNKGFLCLEIFEDGSSATRVAVLIPLLCSTHFIPFGQAFVLFRRTWCRESQAAGHPGECSLPVSSGHLQHMLCDRVSCNKRDL